ncbi:MAG: hypothetical protein LC647_06820, partial [Beggiatoa sp.]|nr:hypothetical protein [Beggiatoa sp.]
MVHRRADLVKTRSSSPQHEPDLVATLGAGSPMTPGLGALPLLQTFRDVYSVTRLNREAPAILEDGFPPLWVYPGTAPDSPVGLAKRTQRFGPSVVNRNASRR